jgi:hypothetical protein
LIARNPSYRASLVRGAVFIKQSYAWQTSRAADQDAGEIIIDVEAVVAALDR